MLRASNSTGGYHLRTENFPGQLSLFNLAPSQFRNVPLLRKAKQMNTYIYSSILNLKKFHYFTSIKVSFLIDIRLNMFLFYTQRDSISELLSAPPTWQSMFICVCKCNVQSDELATAGCINSPCVAHSIFFLVQWLHLSGMATEMKLQLEIH